MTRAALAACLALPALLACGDDPVREPLPDWSDGYPDPDAGVHALDPLDRTSRELQFGTYDDMQPGHFAIVVPRSVRYPIRIRTLEGDAQPCGIEPGDVGGPARDLDCVLDMDELDLLALGESFDVVVPAGCEFLLYRLAMYENYPVGEGPTMVSWTVQPDGSTTDHVNASNGEPDCPFDYRRTGGPNCCIGIYEQRVTHAATGDVDVSVRGWGGKPGECYDGAAYHNHDAMIDQASGFPFAKYVYGEEQSFVEEVRVDGISEHYDSTVPLANYFDPDDHDGGPPAAFTGEWAAPTSDFLCLDHAEEVRARIRLVTREWNEEAEFDADGNPDTGGLEPGWSTRYDDFPDWAVLTPGGDTWPRLARPQR